MSKNRMNGHGVTLVEVMIALTILLIVFMGLIQASLLSIRHNLRNEVRDDGVRVASDAMTEARALGYAAITSAPLVSAWAVPRKSRDLWTTFTVTRTVTVNDPNNCQVRVRVTWTDVADGTPLNHSVISSVRRTTP